MTNNGKKLAILIARVSTKDQEDTGFSLNAQVDLIKEYADRQGILIVKEFIFPESASGTQDRKIYNEMREFRNEHPEVRYLLVEKVDRITRNLKDAVEMNDWLEGDADRQIHFVKQCLVMHKDSKSSDKLQWDIQIVLARNYSNNLSEESRKGVLAKAKEGLYPGNKKRGYLCIATPESGKRKVWVHDTSESSELPFIKRAFELMETGEYDSTTICFAMKEEGWIRPNGKMIAKSTMYELLTDCFYCGEFEWDDIHYPNGKHEGIIEKELFYKVQDILHRDLKNGKARKHSFLLNKLVGCGGCANSVCGQTQKGHVYYRCSHYNPDCSESGCIREEELEEQIVKLLGSIQIKNERLLEWVRKALKESHHNKTEYHSGVVGHLEAEQKKIDDRIEKLYEDKLDGVITKEFYQRKFTQYETRQGEIADKLSRHQKANIDYYELGSSIFDLAQSGAQLYEKTTSVADKRSLLFIVFAKLSLKDGELVPTFHNGFQLIAECAKNSDGLSVEEWLPGLDSNQQPPR